MRRRPPRDPQTIQTRRLVAAVVLVVIVILLALLIHSCQVSQRNSSLKNYNNAVGSIIRQSNQTGRHLFALLSSASTLTITGLQQAVNQARVTATAQHDRAKRLDVPDEMKAAQQNVLLALKMREDGIATVAQRLQEALGTSTSQAGINAIAAEMARFYASDVVYTDYATHHIASALHKAAIAVGGTNGQVIQQGQFVPDIQWLTPSYVATQLQSPGAANNGKVAPGLHGHSLDSVSVGATTLQTGSTNTITANPAPTFTLNFTNSGTDNEKNVACKVTVSGTSASGHTTVPQTNAGKSTSCNVKLNSVPATGSATVVATVQPVPGEKNTANNTQSFPVTFQ